MCISSKYSKVTNFFFHLTILAENFSILLACLKMWHEARKQEKKIRGMLVDYRKRADRRKEFYEKIVSSNRSSGVLLIKNLDNFPFRKLIQIDFFKYMDENVKFIMKCRI